jgi:hypothetical protein
MPAYRLVEFKKVPPPQNTDDYNWFYYVISNEVNRISGYREGTRQEIDHYLKETVTRLNNKFKIPLHSYQHNVRKAYEPGTTY